MPFEAGIGAAIAVLRQGISGQHDFYVLEAEEYRLQGSLSDLTLNAKAHYGTCRGVIRAVLNIFAREAAKVTPEQAWLLFVRLSRRYRIRKAKEGNVFSAYGLGKVIYAADGFLKMLETAQDIQ